MAEGGTRRDSMVNELRIYFEGDDGLRPGFRSFLDEIFAVASSRRCRVKLVATDGRPVEDYYTGLKANPDAWNVLLLDSDAPVDRSHMELCRGKRIEPLRSGSVFWMVHIMESWFLADVASLGAYFGNRFREADAGDPKGRCIVTAQSRRRRQVSKGERRHKAAGKDGSIEGAKGSAKLRKNVHYDSY